MSNTKCHSALAFRAYFFVFVLSGTFMSYSEWGKTVPHYTAVNQLFNFSHVNKNQVVIGVEHLVPAFSLQPLDGKPAFSMQLDLSTFGFR